MLSFPDLHLNIFDLLSYVALFVVVVRMGWRCNTTNEIYRGPALARYRQSQCEEAGWHQLSISWERPVQLQDLLLRSCLAEVQTEKLETIFGSDKGATIPVNVAVTCDLWGDVHATVL